MRWACAPSGTWTSGYGCPTNNKKYNGQGNNKLNIGPWCGGRAASKLSSNPLPPPLGPPFPQLHLSPSSKVLSENQQLREWLSEPPFLYFLHLYVSSTLFRRNLYHAHYYPVLKHPFSYSICHNYRCFSCQNKGHGAQYAFQIFFYKLGSILQCTK